MCRSAYKMDLSMPSDEVSANRGNAADPVRALRTRIRAGAHRTITAGLAPDRVQGNLVVLPNDHADAFEAFCNANPTSLPLIERGRPGDPMLDCADYFDVRSDLPAYLLFRDGAPAVEYHDITALWHDGLTAFVLGCWFGNEAALQAAHIRLRHLELGIQGALYITDRPANPAGPFAGPVVASMRPFADADLDRVAAITAATPTAHGAPIHIGDPAALGIADFAHPDYGDPIPPEPGETPVYWACGLTGQVALERAGLPFFITHKPGCMVVTDIPALIPDAASR